MGHGLDKSDPGDIAFVPEDTALVPGDIGPDPEYTAFVPGDIGLDPEDTVFVPGDIGPDPEDIAFVPGDIEPDPGDTGPDPGDIELGPGDTAFVLGPALVQADSWPCSSVEPPSEAPPYETADSTQFGMSLGRYSQEAQLQERPARL